jgi:hypothetical protein
MMRRASGDECGNLLGQEYNRPAREAGVLEKSREATLTISLTANIIAGHLLITLLGNNGPSIRHTFLTVLITAQIFLLILLNISAFFFFGQSFYNPANLVWILYHNLTNESCM